MVASMNDATALQRVPKAALVTGAAQRIGRALAIELAREGFAVAVHYWHSAHDAQKLVEEIENAGGRAIALSADLAQEDDAANLVPRAVAAFGPLGVLVNNAAAFERDEALDATRASWDLHMQINLRAPFALSQALARALPQGAEGVIVNMVDQRVWRLTPHFVSYTVSKAGLWTLTRTLAMALAPRIRVNAIGPGPVLPSRRQTEQQFERQWRSTPLGRGASLDEIATALRFILVSPALTGQMLALDGGQHLGWPPSTPLPE